MIVGQRKESEKRLGRYSIPIRKAVGYLPVAALALGTIALAADVFSTAGRDYAQLTAFFILLSFGSLGVALGTHEFKLDLNLRSVDRLVKPIEMRPDEFVMSVMKKEGAEHVVREPRLEGLGTAHKPDLLFRLGTKTYIAEIKTRSLVPSDVKNVAWIIDDVNYGPQQQVSGVYLFTPAKPSKTVKSLAKSLRIDIRVVPELDLVYHRSRRRR